MIVLFVGSIRIDVGWIILSGVGNWFVFVDKVGRIRIASVGVGLLGAGVSVTRVVIVVLDVVVAVVGLPWMPEESLDRTIVVGVGVTSVCAIGVRDSSVAVMTMTRGVDVANSSVRVASSSARVSVARVSTSVGVGSTLVESGVLSGAGVRVRGGSAVSVGTIC